MKIRCLILHASLALFCCFVVSCANFRHLGKDLKLLDDGYRISGIIENADEHPHKVRAVVIEWDRKNNRIHAADEIGLTSGGAFVFIVKSPLNQHLAAYADVNSDGHYNPGEAIWYHANASGYPEPIQIDPEKRSVRVRGALSTSKQLPDDMRVQMKRALAGTSLSSVMTHQGVQFAIGELADLDDPRFAATRGEDGLWTPATFAIQSGFGLYFLNVYDPSKTPVLFVHGAAGSPQDWSLAMRRIDRKKYQPWFYVYPSGMRLESAAMALNDGVEELHGRYGFGRLHVVAHSMGGLVSRRFIDQNVSTGGNRYIHTFITFSSPWGGHEAAALGVKYAPTVVPSWRDMANGSSFLGNLFKRPLKGKVNHHLFYSHRASKSRMLPPENDGTVSVASQLRKEATMDAVEVRGFDEDHVSILSSRDALGAAKTILDSAASP